MSRFFINMYIDVSNYSGYWIVEYLDHDGSLQKDQFENDIDAKAFYDELILERTNG